MSRYYETKRQQYLDNLPDRRNKAEKTALQQIDANFMSGKENGEGSQEDVWVVRSLPWRSPQLSPLLKRLRDRRKLTNSGLPPEAHIHKIQE